MISFSTFSQNSAGFGGAIGNSGTLIVTGSTFATNTATSGVVGAAKKAAISSAGTGGAIANNLLASRSTRNDIGNKRRS